MDDHVLRGMAKWPNVPAVYGWLELDRRGQWLIKGERIGNPALYEFIGRNYEHDAHGCWFFQNGPQRVFVELEYTPFVFRAGGAVAAPLELVSHTGAKVATLKGACIDENGAILVDTDVGAGVIDDRDLETVIAALVDDGGRHPDDDTLEAMIESAQRSAGGGGLWLEYRDARAAVCGIASADAPRRFGYDPHPAPPAGHPEC